MAGEGGAAPEDAQGPKKENEAAQAAIPDKVGAAPAAGRPPWPAAAPCRPHHRTTPGATHLARSRAVLVGARPLAPGGVSSRTAQRRASSRPPPAVGRGGRTRRQRPRPTTLPHRLILAGPSGRQPAVHSGQEAGQGRLWPGVPGAARAANQGQGRPQLQRGACAGCRSWGSRRRGAGLLCCSLHTAAAPLLPTMASAAALQVALKLEHRSSKGCNYGPPYEWSVYG